MEFTDNYFGKTNITDITYDDVVRFFQTEREESNKIEFKSFVSNSTESQKEKENSYLKNQKLKSGMERCKKKD